MMADEAKTEETCREMLARIGTDGRAWARAFIARSPGDVDEADLAMWFDNAIKVGRGADPDDFRPAGDEVLVPREPTEAMIRAVDAAAMEKWPNARKMAVALWKAALNAALTQKETTNDQ